jgi:hypothetical protein
VALRTLPHSCTWQTAVLDALRNYCTIVVIQYGHQRTRPEVLAARSDSAAAMSWTDPPPKPTLYRNRTKDARWAKGLLEKYAIDCKERHTSDPFVSLHWNGTTYTDPFGIADFLMFAGRLSLPGMRTGGPNSGR